MKKVQVKVQRVMNPYTYEFEIHHLVRRSILEKFPQVSDVSNGLLDSYLHFERDEDATAFVLKYGEDYKIPIRYQDEYS